MPTEAILKLPYADRSSADSIHNKNSINNRNRDGAKQEHKSQEITYYQLGRKSNKFYQGSLIQVNLSLAYVYYAWTNKDQYSYNFRIVQFNSLTATEVSLLCMKLV